MSTTAGRTHFHKTHLTRSYRSYSNGAHFFSSDITLRLGSSNAVHETIMSFVGEWTNVVLARDQSRSCEIKTKGAKGHRAIFQVKTTYLVTH